VTFREELDDLERELNLRVVHVLSRAESGWQGERGRVGEQLVRRYAPPGRIRLECAGLRPPAMVAEASSTLHRLGMPPAAIQAEGFE
jgi:ferredoxin-NADP reductase